MLLSVLATLVLTSSPSQAGDLGFQYINGKCVNSAGQEGLNLAVFGPCSDLRNAILGGLPLEEIDFSGSRFDSAQLANVKMNKSNFTGASFESADVSGVQMMGATFVNTSFKNATVQNVAFADATFVYANFENANLEGLDLTFVNCQKCNFQKTKMKGANLDSASFALSDFSGAIMRGVNFKSTNMMGANLNGVDFLKASFVKTNFEGASLVKTDFRRDIFTQVNFKKANLGEADLGAATFSDCNVEGASFVGAHYDKRTVLPFTAEEAAKNKMVADSHAADSFVEIKGRGYVKVLVKENLTDPNILAACAAEGLRAPCNDAQNGAYSDDKCLDVGFRDDSQPMASVAEAVCQKRDPRNCGPMDNTFQYMGGKYNGGCGAVGNQWCVDGNNTANAYALCVEDYTLVK